MAAAAGTDVLLDILLVLVAARVAGEVAERMRVPSVIGEILAGIALGPSLFHLLEPGSAGGSEVLATLAEIGAIILLFEVGLESNLKELMRVGKSSAFVAFLGLFVSFFVGIAGAAALASLGYLDARTFLWVFIGATLTATSVGITARVLSDMGRLATAEARIVLGAAVIDDIGGLVILALLASVAATGVLSASLVAQTLLLAAVFLVGAVTIGSRLAPPLMVRASRARSRGVFTGILFAIALAGAYLAGLAGLATIVGAFVAGLTLAGTEMHEEMHRRIRPLADLFMPFFFVSLGVEVDLTAVTGETTTILVVGGVLTVLAVLAKLVAGLGVLDKGVSRMVVGVSMVPRGEVGLIFALFGLRSPAIGLTPAEYTAIVLIVLATTLVAPFWLRGLLRSHARRAEEQAAPPPTPPEPAGEPP